MKSKILKEVFEYLKIIIIAVIIITILNSVVFSLSQVRQSSMEKTLFEKDTIIISKLNYIFTSPKRGDVIAFVLDEDIRGSIINRIKILYEDTYYKFKKEEHRRRLVKRIIGLPGDIIDINNGEVFVNGDKLIEDYVEDDTYYTLGDIKFPIEVKDGEVFVLGDNRDVSRDSRSFGCIPISSIDGKIVFKIYPISKIGLVK